MTKAHTAILLALLLLPTLTLALLSAHNEQEVASARHCQLKITGYDPRSLLYGHYISFRFDKQDTADAQECLGLLKDLPAASRYYTDESLAPKIEALLREPKNIVTLDVSVRAGKRPILGDLYINGQNSRSLALP